MILLISDANVCIQFFFLQLRLILFPFSCCSLFAFSRKKHSASKANAEEIHLRFHTQIVMQMQIFELVKDSAMRCIHMFVRVAIETLAKEMTRNRKDIEA